MLYILKSYILSSYLESKGLSWGEFFGICPDGVPSTVSVCEVWPLIKKIWHNTLFSSREVLVSEALRKKCREFWTMLKNG